MQVINVSESVEEIFRVTGFDSFFVNDLHLRLYGVPKGVLLSAYNIYSMPLHQYRIPLR